MASVTRQVIKAANRLVSFLLQTKLGLSPGLISPDMARLLFLIPSSRIPSQSICSIRPIYHISPCIDVDMGEFNFRGTIQ